MYAPPEAPSWIRELAHYCTRRTAGSWAYGFGLPDSRHLGHHDTGACAGRVEQTRRHSQAQRGTDEGGGEVDEDGARGDEEQRR